LKGADIWGVKPYIAVEVRRRYEGTYCLYPQGKKKASKEIARRVYQAVQVSLLLVFLAYTLTVKKEAVNFSEISTNIYRTQGVTIQVRRLEVLKSNMCDADTATISR
jgi:hypothetical protein